MAGDVGDLGDASDCRNFRVFEHVTVFDCISLVCYCMAVLEHMFVGFKNVIGIAYSTTLGSYLSCFLHHFSKDTGLWPRLFR